MLGPERFDFAAVGELKQNINLSESAFDVFAEDQRNYHTTEAGLFNQIFINFYEDALASIDIRLEQKREELEKFYQNKLNVELYRGITEATLERYLYSKPGMKDKEDYVDEELDRFCSSKKFDGLYGEIVDNLVETSLTFYEKELIERAKSYPKGVSKKIRLNKRTLEILRDLKIARYYRKGKPDENEIHEGDKAIGPYLKAVFEEYASKPAYERERIYYRDYTDMVLRAIRYQYQLKMVYEKYDRETKTNKDFKVLVSPYDILPDKEGVFNYVVGFGREYDSATKDLKPTSNRFSHIKAMSEMRSSQHHLSKKEIAQLEEELKTKGVSYLADNETIKVKVRLSERGKKLYRRILHLRPNNYVIDEENPNIYIFETTYHQAENYFTRFTGDAEILEPEGLRNHMKRKFDYAANLYKKDEE